MVNFGIQNLQEYNMANGFLSQIAAARSAGRAQGGIAGLQLGRTGMEEMRGLEDEIRQMEEQMRAEEESARKREGRRGRGRLVGGLLGGLGALATGGGSLLIGAASGLGSAAGQELGARGLGTAKGLGSRKRRLGRIQEGLRAPGLFHSGKREDVELKRKDLNRFLRDADRQFDESVIAGALTDALTGYKFGESELGKFATEEKGLFKGYGAMQKSRAAERLAAEQAKEAAAQGFRQAGRLPKPTRPGVGSGYQFGQDTLIGDKSISDMLGDFTLGGMPESSFDPLSFSYDDMIKYGRHQGPIYTGGWK